MRGRQPVARSSGAGYSDAPRVATRTHSPNSDSTTSPSVHSTPPAFSFRTCFVKIFSFFWLFCFQYYHFLLVFLFSNVVFDSKKRNEKGKKIRRRSMHFQSRTRPITWSTNSVDDFFLEKKTTYKEWIGYYSLIVIACVCVCISIPSR